MAASGQVLTALLASRHGPPGIHSEWVRSSDTEASSPANGGGPEIAPRTSWQVGSRQVGSRHPERNVVQAGPPGSGGRGVPAKLAGVLRCPVLLEERAEPRRQQSFLEQRSKLKHSFLLFVFLSQGYGSVLRVHEKAVGSGFQHLGARLPSAWLPRCRIGLNVPGGRFRGKAYLRRPPALFPRGAGQGVARGTDSS